MYQPKLAAHGTVYDLGTGVGRPWKSNRAQRVH